MALDRFRPDRSRKIHFSLLIAVLILLAFGLIVMSSASVVVAWKEYGSNYFFLVRQLWAAVIGIGFLVFCTMVDYRWWQRLAPWIGVAILLMLLLPHIPGVGVVVKGAQRWVRIAGVSLQFSEPVKLFAILYLSAWLVRFDRKIEDFKQTFIPFIVTLGLIVIPILLQPDAGTAITLAVTLVLIYFVAGAPPLHMGYVGILGALGIGLILQSPYRAQRLLVFLNPDKETLGAGYHINQALLAIGSGGWFGLGFGQSNQKYLFLPEVQTDSIFAVATEELGFVRKIGVLLLFALIVYLGYRISQRVPDRFGQLVAFGITTLFAFQALVNVGAMLGVMPLTGVTLPLVSYGGSSLVTMLAAVGILLSISKHVERSQA